MYHPHCGLSIPLVPEEKGSTCAYGCFCATIGFSGCSRLFAPDRTDRDRDIAERIGISAAGFGSCIGCELCSFPMVREKDMVRKCLNKHLQSQRMGRTSEESDCCSEIGLSRRCQMTKSGWQSPFVTLSLLVLIRW